MATLVMASPEVLQEDSGGGAADVEELGAGCHQRPQRPQEVGMASPYAKLANKVRT